MELSKDFFGSNDLEHLCQKILNSKKDLQECLRRIEGNFNWIGENFVGIVSAETLNKIIKRSICDVNYRNFLINIIDLIEGQTINDDIFKQLIEFPDRETREYFEVSMAHKKLSEQQLIFLCDSQNTFECFFELAILYYKDNAYDKEIFEKFIVNFNECKYSYMLGELLGELIECCVASSFEKKEYVEGLLLKNKRS